MRGLRISAPVWILVLAVGVAVAPHAFAQPNPPHTVWGAITNADASVPDPGDITFTATIAGKGTLTESSTGCVVETVGAETQYSIECGYFDQAWADGDVLVIQMNNTSNGQAKTVNVTIDERQGFQRQDIQLEIQVGAATKLAFTAQPPGICANWSIFAPDAPRSRPMGVWRCLFSLPSTRHPPQSVSDSTVMRPVNGATVIR